MKNKILFFAVIFLLVFLTQSCTHAGGPVKETTLANYVRSVLAQFFPYKIPSLELEIEGGISFNLSDSILTNVNFSSVSFQLTAADTVLFTLDGLTTDLFFDFIGKINNNVTNGKGEITLLDTSLTITSVLTPDSFKNIASTFKVGSLNLKASNMDVLEPYWDFLRPIVIDTLQREIPNTLMSLDTQVIKTLIVPIIKGVEPIHLPNVNLTVLGVFGGFTNLILENIDFTSATIERGPSVNEVTFALTGLSAYIQNDWFFKFGTRDEKGSGHIAVGKTSISITIKISQKNSEFYIDLDTAKINIGSLDIRNNGPDPIILQWLINQLQPLVLAALEDTFDLIVCILFNGIPSI